MFSKGTQYHPIDSASEEPTDEPKDDDLDTSTLLFSANREDRRNKNLRWLWPPPPSAVAYCQRLALFISGLALGIALGVLALKATYHRTSCRPDPSSQIDRWPVGRKDVLFMNDSKYVNEAMWTSKDGARETLHEWVGLSSKDRGVVKVSPEERDGLPPPVVFSRDLKGPQPVYFTSAFHQLHCLSSIALSFAALRQGEDPRILEEKHTLGHVTHCFDYIRQSILCAGDTTLEGRSTDGSGELPIGWGPVHDCRDWSQIMEWADARQPWDGPYYPGWL